MISQSAWEALNRYGCAPLGSGAGLGCL